MLEESADEFVKLSKSCWKWFLESRVESLLNVSLVSLQTLQSHWLTNKSKKFVLLLNKRGKLTTQSLKKSGMTIFARLGNLDKFLRIYCS